VDDPRRAPQGADSLLRNLTQVQRWDTRARANLVAPCYKLVESGRHHLGASKRGAVQFCLRAAVGVPIVYFGAQLIASAFYPGYSFLRQAASMLGSPNSSHPGVFNAGAIITGVALITGGYGIYRALRSRGVSPVYYWLAWVSMTVVGCTCIQAGIFPLPDPRHTAFPFLVVFLIAIPFIFLLALWKQADARGIRVFLVVCCAVVLLMVPLMSRAIVIPGAGAGLLQRIFAAATFLPVGVIGWKLRSSRINE